MRILFLLQAAEHVRFRKRVELLMYEGVNAEVMAFERNSYPGKELPCKYTALDSIEHRNYAKRLLPFIGAIKRIRAAAKKHDAVYAFGLDMLLLGWVSSLGLKSKMVFEVGDIRQVLLGSGFRARMFRALERYLLKKTDLLVVTSKAFVTEYYYRIQKVNDIKYLVLENKLDPRWTGKFGLTTKKDINKREAITIGYFGVLRCSRSWDILIALATMENSKFKINLRGISRIIDLDEAEKTKNISYGGPYIAPDELQEMYDEVDLVWVCYPYQGKEIGNWKWAKTIRFYEACYYKTPLIAQAGTEDGRLINKYGLGITIDMGLDVLETINIFKKIDETDIERWRHNIEKMPEELYIYQDEHARLVETLRTEYSEGGKSNK